MDGWNAFILDSFLPQRRKLKRITQYGCILNFPSGNKPLEIHTGESTIPTFTAEKIHLCRQSVIVSNVKSPHGAGICSVIWAKEHKCVWQVTHWTKVGYSFKTVLTQQRMTTRTNTTHHRKPQLYGFTVNRMEIFDFLAMEVSQKNHWAISTVDFNFLIIILKLGWYSKEKWAHKAENVFTVCDAALYTIKPVWAHAFHRQGDVLGKWANINQTHLLMSSSGFRPKRRSGMCPVEDRQEKNLSFRSQKPTELRSTSDHVRGVTIVILHAYHHPFTPAECSSAPSTHRLDRQQSFKGISSSCWSYLLPPLNTAGEFQDSAVVTENYLWWEICRGKSAGRRKKT